MNLSVCRIKHEGFNLNSGYAKSDFLNFAICSLLFDKGSGVLCGSDTHRRSSYEGREIIMKERDFKSEVLRGSDTRGVLRMRGGKIVILTN
jgi:hypothetical protein